jgi:hypothetical protein
MNDDKDTAAQDARLVWASFDCEGPEYLTRGKRYWVTSEAGDIFWIVDDEGDEISSYWVRSYHIDGGNWTRHTSPNATEAGLVADMLEALKAAKTFIALGGDQPMMQLVRQIDAAIAKAEGKQ